MKTRRRDAEEGRDAEARWQMLEEQLWRLMQEVHRRAMEVTMKEAEGGEQGQG